MVNFFHYKYYEILELQPGASLDEIKAAYRDLCKIWHPDRFSESERLQLRAETKLKEINEAYEILRKNAEAEKKSQAGRSHAQPRQQPRPEPQNTQSKTYSHTHREQKSDFYNFDDINKTYSEYSDTASSTAKYAAYAFLILIGIAFFAETKMLSRFFEKTQEIQPAEDVTQAQGEEQEKTKDEPKQKPIEFIKIIPTPQLLNQEKAKQIVFIPTTKPAPPRPTPSPRKISIKRGSYFSMGSISADVISVQGEPDSITGGPLLDYEVWHYGPSTVTISTSNRRVVEWSNDGNNLMVRLKPGKQITQAEHIKPGMHKDDVLRLHGTPDKIMKSRALGYEILHYGLSTVKISLNDETVQDVRNKGKNLKTKQNTSTLN
ncbi:DnaJ domain-containing protein [bacterium]|nr:DnaJ domain-containing protein [bacterium]